VGVSKKTKSRVRRQGKLTPRVGEEVGKTYNDSSTGSGQEKFKIEAEKKPKENENSERFSSQNWSPLREGALTSKEPHRDNSKV